MLRSPLKSAAAVVAILTLLASCGRGKPGWKGTVSEADGIQVVKNPKEPLYPGPVLTLERDLVINGGADTGSEAQLTDIASLDVGSDDSVFILSRQESAVFVFDREGRFLRRFGRKGQGPGEIESPLSAQVQGREVVVPQAVRRVSFFSTDGEFLRALATKEYRVLVAAMDSKKNVYATVGVMDTDNPLYKLVRFDGTMGSPREITSSPAPNAVKGYNPFMPVSRWQIDPADNVIYSRPADYTLEFYDPEGRLFRKVTRAFEPVRVTEEEKTERKKVIPPEIKVAFSDFHPAFGRFHCDDVGRLFVGTFEKSPDGDYIHDVFDPEGRFITRVSFKGVLLKVVRGRMYCREEDEQGFQKVVRYRLVWRFG